MPIILNSHKGLNVQSLGIQISNNTLPNVQTLYTYHWLNPDVKQALYTLHSNKQNCVFTILPIAI